MSNNDMAPFEIRDELLRKLRAVRNGFFKAEAAAALDEMSESEKAEAGVVLVNTGVAIRKLENIELADIRDQLKNFEGELKLGAEKLGDALEDLRKFKRVVDSAASVLSLLGRIAKLVGVSLP